MSLGVLCAPFCPEEDSKSHRLAECAAFAEVRQPYLETLQYLISEGRSMLGSLLYMCTRRGMLTNYLNFKSPEPFSKPGFLI